MNLLVTGGAGFIGSNFVRYWLDRHPGDDVVVLDLLTYAGVRANVPDASADFVRATSRDVELAERTLQEHTIDVVVNFAAESHNSYAVVDPGRFFRTNVLGTQTLLEAARRTRPAAASTTSQPARSTATSRSTAPTPSARSRRTLRGRRTTRRRRRPTTPSAPTPRPMASRSRSRTARTTTGRPVPREGHSALPDQRARRPPAPALLVDAEPARVAARRRPLPGHRARPRARAGRRDLQRRLRDRGLDRGDRRQHPRAHPEAGLAQVDRPRPSRTRPALPARLVEAADGARLGARGGVRCGPRGDGGLVCGQSRLVGTAQGARAGR